MVTTEKRGGYSAEGFARLADVQTGHYWFESRNRLIAWAIRRYFPDARNFLDVGCGTGFVLDGIRAGFPQMALAGCDFPAEGLAFARQHLPSVPFFRCDARQFHVARPFDIAGAFDVIEHIEDDDRVLACLHDAVRPGGGLLITVPQHMWLWSQADDDAKHVRRYRRDELAGKVRRAGFDVLRTTSFVSLLLPAMAASRLRRGGGTREARQHELRVSGPANTVLTALLTVERSLVNLGVSWPAGGSLLLVARRRP